MDEIEKMMRDICERISAGNPFPIVSGLVYPNDDEAYYGAYEALKTLVEKVQIQTRKDMYIVHKDLPA